MEPESTFRRKTMRVKWTAQVLVAAVCIAAGVCRSHGEEPTKPGGEFRAVKFTGDDKADTAKLNELAADGWEYVGPLTGGTVAFRRHAVSELGGTWAKVSGEEAGVATEAGAEPDTFVVEGNRWVYKSGDKVLQAGTFTIDASKSPKHFTFTVTEGGNVGGVGYAIYKRDGDTFAYCAAGPDARPTDFTTKPGDGRYILTWKKAKK
jgi:uncharacterized protein (TIGR03067 family)